MKPNTISFVIPAYNCASTVVESVDSIMQGNFESGDEVIIVNDHSTDKTRSVLSKLQKKYPVIRIIENEKNIGCSASRNVGIRTAKNPFIFNLDADNILVPGSVAKLKAFLIAEHADVAAFSDTRFFLKKPTNPTHSWIFPRKQMTLADFLAGYVNPGLGGNFIYTRASWERIGGYWEYGKGLHDAWGFTFKQLINGAKFAVMPDSYYLHRYGIESVTVRELKKEKNESYIIATQMIMHGIGLINDEDAAYIRNEREYNKNWIDKLGERPIRLKSGEPGETGYRVTINIPLPLPQRIAKKILPPRTYDMLKNFVKSALKKQK